MKTWYKNLLEEALEKGLLKKIDGYNYYCHPESVKKSNLAQYTRLIYILSSESVRRDYVGVTLDAEGNPMYYIIEE